MKILQSSFNQPGLVQKLIRNYRALPAIVDFYNKQFYDSELISTLSSGDSAEAQLLKEVRRQQILPVSSQASFGLYFIDVDNGKNKKKRGAKSWLNVEELITVSWFFDRTFWFCEINRECIFFVSVEIISAEVSRNHFIGSNWYHRTVPFASGFVQKNVRQA